MSDSIKNKVTEEELRRAFVGNSTSKEKPHNKVSKNDNNTIKAFWICTAMGTIGFIAGCGMILYALLSGHEEQITNTINDSFEEKKAEEYSALTGEVLKDASLKNAPTYCVQTPNGLDGARPQAGLNEAGVIFEAIAEAGITRFAAIYQNPSAAVIGPVRSLRMYYLDWDTPFGCTIVHAGGADDALAMLSSGGYRDLTEDYQYMYRGTYGGRLWNNLFTSASFLKKYNEGKSYNTSEVKGFLRLTPEESSKERVDHQVKQKLVITQSAPGDTSEIAPETTSVSINFGSLPSYNVKYDYNVDTNTYMRSYGNGEGHMIYNCPAEEMNGRNPEDVCNLTQMTPSVVVVMVVPERKAADNYHEIIDTIGSGNAYIFQNGIVIQGGWRKTSRGDQIKFTDKDGNEIKLAPGQTFISAIPSYGSVDF